MELRLKYLQISFEGRENERISMKLQKEMSETISWNKK